jgi:GT2 family glycosyltransferase
VAGEERPTVSIIVVNWNCEDLLARCLQSIADHVSLRVETIVVDNASSDDSVSVVRARFPAVRLIALPENVGFSRANNVAIEVARGDHVLLLNPDTELRRGCVESLVAFLEERPRVGLVGPPLFDPDGSRQDSVLEFPTLGREFLRQTMLHRLVPGRAARTRPEGSRRVEALTGAALCVRRACLEAIGPLDPRLFMFYEDVDWCRRATDAGFEVWFAAGPGAMHVKSAASGRLALARTLVESLRSTIAYFRKHRGARSVAGLRAVALAGAATRSVRAAVLWSVGRDRAEQRDRLGAYGRIARWALRGGELQPWP